MVARLRAAGSVFAEEEAELLASAAADPTDLASMVERRVAGEPVEAIVGWASFCGLRIVVAAGVFVPRRRTELLVREALAIVPDVVVAREASKQPVRPGLSLVTVVELCCGTAAVAAAILAGMGTSDGALEVHAADVDPRATACARENLAGRGEIHTGDLYDALPGTLRGRVDLLVANAPYVPTDAIAMMPPEARDHEPRIALDGGPDGLDVQRRIIEHAHEWLAPGGDGPRGARPGVLLIETSRGQAAGTLAACEAVRLVTHVVVDDELDATAVVAVAP